MKKGNQARGMLAVSMVVFGTIGLFVRRIGLPSGEIALIRAVLAAILIGAYLLLTRQRIRLGQIRKELPALAVSGMAMGFNWILLFEAYKYTTVSVATLSYYFAPVLVTLACPFLFGEKMTAKKWICFAMSTLGIVLITGIGDLSSGSNHLRGVMLGLGAAMLYATVILINKKITGVDGIQRTFLQFLAAIAVLAPYVMTQGGLHLARTDAVGAVCLLVVGMIHTGVTYCLYFSALRHLPGQEAAILSYIDPLTAVVISVVLLGEVLTGVQLFGGVLILGFTLWNELT